VVPSFTKYGGSPGVCTGEVPECMQELMLEYTRNYYQHFLPAQWTTTNFATFCHHYKTVDITDTVVYFSQLPFPISKSWHVLQTIFLLQILKSELQVLLWFLLFVQLFTTFWTDSLWTGVKIQLFKDNVRWVYSAVIWIKNGTNWNWLNVLKVGIKEKSKVQPCTGTEAL